MFWHHFATSPHFHMNVYDGELRHLCDDPVRPDPGWKQSICARGAVFRSDGTDPIRTEDARLLIRWDLPDVTPLRHRELDEQRKNALHAHMPHEAPHCWYDVSMALCEHMFQQHFNSLLSFTRLWSCTGDSRR